MKSKPDLSTAAAVEKRFKEITDFVNSSVQEIESNAEVDLMGIEYAVDHVCEAFAELPDEDQDNLDKYLGSMVKALENLALTLRHHPDIAETAATDFLDYALEEAEKLDNEDWDEDEDEDE